MDPINGTKIITEQIAALLGLISNDIYSKPLSTFNGSTVGQHIRHIIDFYLCLIRGTNANTIDYDHRERDPLLETNVEVAHHTVQEIARRVEQLHINQKVKVNTCFTPDLTEEEGYIFSSVGRELMYAYDHAIHHLAMIKIGMHIHYPEIGIDKDLGVAPSTLKYRKKVAR